MLRTGCLLAPQRDFVVTLRRSGLPYRRPPATALLGHYAGRTLTGKFITAFRTHTTAPPPRHTGISRRLPSPPPGRLLGWVGDRRDGSRVHCQPIDGLGAQLCPCNLVTATPQTFTVTSRTGDINRPTSSPPSCGGCASLPSPHPPGWSWCIPLERRSAAGSSRTPSRLASRTRPVWQYQAVPALSGAASHPHRRLAGSDCPQLLPRHCDGTATVVFHLRSVEQRLTALDVSDPQPIGRGGPELAVDQVGRCCRMRITDRGEHRLAALHTA